TETRRNRKAKDESEKLPLKGKTEKDEEERSESGRHSLKGKTEKIEAEESEGASVGERAQKPEADLTRREPDSSFPSMEAFASASASASEQKSLAVASHPLREMTRYEETLADFAGTGLTTGAHPMSYWREKLARGRVIPTVELPRRARGER